MKLAPCSAFLKQAGLLILRRKNVLTSANKNSMRSAASTELTVFVLIIFTKALFKASPMVLILFFSSL